MALYIDKYNKNIIQTKFKRFLVSYFSSKRKTIPENRDQLFSYMFEFGYEKVIVTR